MEQQLPFGQFPQTVLPLDAPQVPSVVTAPAPPPPTGAMTGSPVVAAGGAPLEVDVPSVHPL